MNEKITTDRIIELMMAQTGRDRTAVQTFVGELTALVNDSLIKDGSTRIKGIGKFRIVPVRERESVTPEGERIVIPAHHWLSYLPDKSLKDRINKPFAIFEAVEASESDAPIETPEDPEREYVDDEEAPADEAPLSTPSFISTPENELTDSEPEPTEPTPAPPAPTAETGDDEEDEGDDDVEPVALIGSTWNNEKSQTMNSEIKKEIAEGWSEGRSVGSKPMTVGEMAAAHLKASQIITPEVTAEKVDTKAPEPAQKDEPKAPLATGRTDTPTSNAGRTNEQRPPRKKPVTVIPPIAPPPPVEPTPQPKKSEKRSSSNFPLYVVLSILLLLLLGGLFYHYFYYLPSSETRAMGRTDGDKVVTGDTFVMPGEEAKDKDAPEAGRGDKPQTSIADEQKLDPATAADKARRAAAEKEAKEKAKAEEEAKAKEDAKAKEKKEKPAAPKRKVVATVRLEPGQFLTKLAEKYYGNKVFWVYIYEFNKSKIADPNHIPTNMEIKIPAKELYGIDADNSASVEKAKAIQARLNAQK